MRICEPFDIVTTVTEADVMRNSLSTAVKRGVNVKLVCYMLAHDLKIDILSYMYSILEKHGQN
jgi:hypothetical protein